MNSLLVEFWSRVFGLLKWVSVFQYLQLFNRKLRWINPYLFVEILVIANIILSIGLIFLAKYVPLGWGNWIFVVLGFLRIFEIFVYQVNVLLFDEYRAQKRHQAYHINSYRRVIILLTHNFFEIIFWFSFIYVAFNYDFTGDVQNYSVLEIIYQSFVKMTNFGSAQLEPNNFLGLQIIWFQSLVGLFMTLIVLARFISLLSRPESQDE